MKKVIIPLIILITLNCVSAQNYSDLDTVYTPDGFRLGDFMSTICIPENPNGVGIVIAHGAYSAGPFQRETMRIWCDTLAANGYTAMTIDYYNIDVKLNEEVDSSAAYPGQATTLKHAVEFLRRNADRFHIFTNKIVGFGMSAGAFSWAQTITWENDDAFFETDPEVSDHVDATVLLYGPYDNYNYPAPANPNPDLLREKHFVDHPELAATKGNPIVNTSNITAPVFMAHGTADANVLYQHSVQFHDSLLANGKSSQLVSYPGRAHVFELNNFFPPHNYTEDGIDLKNHILAFLDSTVLAPASDIRTRSAEIIEHFELYQNYPNPFNPSTTIRFMLPSGSYVNLNLYNSLGQKVKSILNKRMVAGVHEIDFNAHNLAGGGYYYQLVVGDPSAGHASGRIRHAANSGQRYREVKKMIILK